MYDIAPIAITPIIANLMEERKGGKKEERREKRRKKEEGRGTYTVICVQRYTYIEYKHIEYTHIQCNDSYSYRTAMLSDIQVSCFAYQIQ